MTDELERAAEVFAHEERLEDELVVRDLRRDGGDLHDLPPAPTTGLHAVEGLGLESRRLEQLKTAVGETVMNAIEHGNENRLELDVDVEVCANEDTVSVRITDQGGDKVIPEAALPDIEAKLSGEQTPRGWGLFLIEKGKMP